MSQFIRSSFALLIVVVGVLSATGCASALKKKCQDTNWFKHGQKVALGGERLNADSFAKQCRKEKVDVDDVQMDLGFKSGMQSYCELSEAFAIGKRGVRFNLTMCDSGKARSLTESHKKGVEEYCRPENGKAVGASGGVYSGICPKELEPAFMPIYQKARHGYLTGLIEGKESESVLLQQLIGQINQNKSNLSVELSSLPSSTMLVRERKHDAATNTYREVTKTVENPDVVRRKRALQSELYIKEDELKNAMEQQNSLRKEITKLKAERAALQ
jgi:hypothetical protein